MSLQIRKSTAQDLPELFELYAAARKFMAEHGNPDQWGDSHPRRELIEEGVASGASYVCTTEDGKIAGSFTLFDSEETYEVIYDGAWLNDAPYLVLHSVAAYPGFGAGSFMLNFVKGLTDNIRIDTKDTNAPMRSLLEKLGFVYCGIIYLKEGRGERVAYQWCRSQAKAEAR